MYGCGGLPTEWGGETLRARVVAEEQDTVSRSLAAAMETGALHFQCRIRRQDGSLGSIVVDGRVYHAEDGAPVRIAGVLADGTERRRIEALLEQTPRLQGLGAVHPAIAHTL